MPKSKVWQMNGLVTGLGQGYEREEEMVTLESVIKVLGTFAIVNTLLTKLLTCLQH